MCFRLFLRQRNQRGLFGLVSLLEALEFRGMLFPQQCSNLLLQLLASLLHRLGLGRGGLQRLCLQGSLGLLQLHFQRSQAFSHGIELLYMPSAQLFQISLVGITQFLTQFAIGSGPLLLKFIHASTFEVTLLLFPSLLLFGKASTTLIQSFSLRFNPGIRIALNLRQLHFMLGGRIR